MITFRYRIRPTLEQVVTLDRFIETCRRLYNRLLCELSQGRKEGRVLSKAAAQALLPVWKRGDFPELGNVYAKVAQMVVQQLYANLAGLARKKGRGHKVGRLRYKGRGHKVGRLRYKGRGHKVGRLRYKGRGWYTSLNYNQSGFKLDWARGKIRLAKVGVIKATFHRVLPMGLTVKGIIVKRTQVNRWFACFQCAEKPARAI